MNTPYGTIDAGKPFDFGRTAADYAKYRDIYPREFYQKIINRNLCVKGQTVLDIGTGTGVLPRNLCSYGANWTGIDLSEAQIDTAKELSQGLNISYFAASAENPPFADGSFDVITACQCFWYFDHKNTAQVFRRLLRNHGSLLLLCMEWLPFEDEIAAESERLVLKYSPHWTGAEAVMHPIEIPACYTQYFEPVSHEEFRLQIPFTRKSWHGRMMACRGIGASLTAPQIAAWEEEHQKLLAEIAPEHFTVAHYAAIAELKKRDGIIL
ncbi:MAG: methyltransferase domain-containing protein [Oscillospiraceae bacterium]|nr:methyltransferase domain-containing protein [Oscillospiraceae bacterium]